MVLARGADPDAQDTNGNTVLHMLVIYEKVSTFDMAYEVGSTLSIRNTLNLTPLTLAAKLGRVSMFFHILNIEREIYWQLGSVTCAAYPLSQIDTIDVETGHISKDSALNLVVFGDKDEHLELMDGVLIDLLKVKWNTFVKRRFYQQFYLFATYFSVSLVSFILRPGPDIEEEDDDAKMVQNEEQKNSTIREMYRDLVNVSDASLLSNDTVSGIFGNASDVDTDLVWVNKTTSWWGSYEECPLMDFDTPESKMRIVSEVILLVGAVLYILSALRESRFLGYKMFVENLVS